MLNRRWSTPPWAKCESSMPRPFSPCATRWGMNRNVSARRPAPDWRARNPKRLTTTLTAMIAIRSSMPTGHSSDGLHGFEIRAELPRGVGVDARLLDQLFGAMRQPLQELVPGLPSVIGGDDELRAVRLDRVRRGDLPDEIRKERRAQEDLEADGGGAARREPESATSPPDGGDRDGDRGIDCRGRAQDGSGRPQQEREHRAADEEQCERARGERPDGRE